jgi:capsular polysaccharide transport system permease protein
MKPSQHLHPQNNLATPPHKETSPETNRSEKTPPAVANNTTDTTPANQIEAIQKEGLTGRQLRMARRIANEHKLPAQTDFDAVRLLRAKGIDPFNRSNPLDWISPEQNQNKSPSPDNAKVQLPQKIEKAPETLPSTDVNPIDRRSEEIRQIQLEITRRRRRKALMLLARLVVFVFLPTAVTAWYFYFVATPLYSTKAEFLILNAEGSASAGAGGLLSGTGLASSQDAVSVQNYLLSKEAMLRLDNDVGFKAHFSQSWIDPLLRLDKDASNEKAYKLYKRNLEIGYDPTEGVLKMEVTATDPAVSKQYAEALIAYSEEKVDNLSRRKRDNQVADAEKALEKAHQERLDAQERLLRLQQENAVVDPQGKLTAMRARITHFETELQLKRLRLQALLDNPRPNTAKLSGLKGDIRRLIALLDEMNLEMVDASQGEQSLADLSLQILMAQGDLQTRDMMLQRSLENLIQTQREASSQVRYLTTSVSPVEAQDPSYPKKFENAILAALIFSGIYLMLSLTASILREQVSS